MPSRTFMMMNGDVVFDDARRPVFAEGAQKAAQDLGEMLLSAYVPPKGTGNDLIRMDMVGATSAMTAGQVDMMIREAVERLIRIQQQNGAPASERISKIKSLVVRAAGVGSFIFILDVGLLDNTSLKRTFRVTSTHHNDPSFERYAARASMTSRAPGLGRNR